MPAPGPVAAFRITYQRQADVREDLDQMARGGLLVKVADAAELGYDTPVAVTLVFPDRTAIDAQGTVLHAFPGVGIAVSIGADVLERVRRSVAAGGRDAGTAPARHERAGAAPPEPEPAAEPASAPARPRGTTAAPGAADTLSNADKIQLALHGTRDQRNAILRDNNRTLHPYVLKNPQTNSEDALAIAKNNQSSPDLLRLLAERKEWFQRPQIALALARNPKTPQDIAIRALDYVPADALRHLAKGTGAPPQVVQAARKKVLR